MHDIVFSSSVLCLAILLLIFLLKRFHQPYLIAYILAGILLGPHCLDLLADGDNITTLGSLGVLFLMFFLGMEIDIPDTKSLLLKPVIAQGIKTSLSVLLSVIIGYWVHLPPGAIILLTVLFAFNSTAAVSELLRQKGELHSDMSKTLLNMLLLQDVMLAPILTLFQFAGKHNPGLPRFLLSMVACVLLFLLLRAIRNRKLYELPILQEMGEDHELQVFAGGCVCLGFAALASFAGLSAPVGAFAAGLYIGKAEGFHWLETALNPFKVFFTSLFFVTLGLLVDISFLRSHAYAVFSITVLILVVNSLLSAVVFRLLKYSWKSSLSAGALLSQTGEFSLIACTLANKAGLINSDTFKSVIAIIVLTLLLSAPWAAAFRRLVEPQQ